MISAAPRTAATAYFRGAHPDAREASGERGAFIVHSAAVFAYNLLGKPTAGVRLHVPERLFLQQQQQHRWFSSGFPNTKKHIKNPFWRRQGWWKWRQIEVGKLNKERALRRHLWPRFAASAAAAEAYTPAAAATKTTKVAAAAADKSNFLWKQQQQQGLPKIDSVLAVEGARIRPVWKPKTPGARDFKQRRLAFAEMDRQQAAATAAAERAAADFFSQSSQQLDGGGQQAEAIFGSTFSRPLTDLHSTKTDAGAAGAGSASPNHRKGAAAAAAAVVGTRLRVTAGDILWEKKGRCGRVWEERKSDIPLGKKRLLLYCRLIKGLQLTDAIDWLSSLCIHRVNYLLNLLLRTRVKIHEEGGDVSRVYIESYLLNIQGRAKRLQFRLRMVNFVKTWRFAVTLRFREISLNEFFHRLFVLKKVPRSLVADMRLALVEKRVNLHSIREWYPYIDASTRFWHRQRLRWLDRTRQFDYFLARKAFILNYGENVKRQRVQILEARGAPQALIEAAKEN